MGALLVKRRNGGSVPQCGPPGCRYMHIRVARVKSGGRVREYPQLVQSYRRPDGKPAHRVVLGLSKFSSLQIENLRTALAASRKGQALVLPEASTTAPSRIKANLAYLDVAVALQLWKRLKLDEIVREALGDEDTDISTEEVVAALVIQRCVDPDSKLAAQRWFPRTALPELLNVQPAQFNNSRIHRALNRLDIATLPIQSALANATADREGDFGVLFLDTSDTWFVGRGPELATPGKTKEGLYRRKIGILLLCNRTGFPLRWETLPGRQHDSQAMRSTFDALRDTAWAKETLVVCDRAVGKTAHLRALLATGVRFLTALSVDEIAAYCNSVPCQPLAELGVGTDDVERRAAQAVTEAGMKKVKGTLYVLDLGVVERAGSKDDLDAVDEPSGFLSVGDQPLAHDLARAKAIHEALESGQASTLAEAGRPFGLKKTSAHTLLKLLKLSPAIRGAVLSGEAAHLSRKALLAVAAIEDVHDQHEEFEQQSRREGTRRGGSRGRKKRRKTKSATSKEAEIRVRAVLGFNPESFVTQRANAEKLLEDIYAFVRNLNCKLLTARTTKEKVYAKVDAKLRKAKLLSVMPFQVEMKEGHFSVAVRLDKAAWQKRRRYDGFWVLVAHPDTLKTAEELARLYRAKDKVEQDFHVIKSVLDIRPVRHRVDVKVRAHVTLCMLALAIQRELERYLPKTEVCRSADAALALLSNIFLNQQRMPEDAGELFYSVTQESSDQRDLLAALDMLDLVDTGAVTTTITPMSR